MLDFFLPAAIKTLRISTSDITSYCAAPPVGRRDDQSLLFIDRNTFMCRIRSVMQIAFRQALCSRTATLTIADAHSDHSPPPVWS